VKNWNKFIEVFDVLPLAAVVDKCIFATHGGLSPDLYSLDQIRCIRRPVAVPEGGLVCDLLWADPDLDQDVAVSQSNRIECSCL
jgi:serine/threonine-protein phosphatase PP1 catalytic subunit